MGGYLSGRHGGRATIEGSQSLVLDINWFMRRGAIRRGRRSEGHLTIGGRLQANFAIDCLGAATAFVELNGEAETVEHGRFPLQQRISLTTAPTNFGGRRWLFVCPRTGRRVTKLYLPNGGRFFAGRRAYGLDYLSERLTRSDRLARKARRLHRKLGGNGEALGGDTPNRPKGMRRVTYERLLARWQAADEAAEGAWFAGVLPLLRRCGKWPPK